MGIRAFVCVLWISYIRFVNGSILCVDCESHEDVVKGDCAERPPAPTRCANNARFCTITREYDRNGTVIKFIRSCTPRNHGYQCVSVPENAKSGLAKYCTSTCDFDGCNTAQYLIPPPLHRLCLFVVIAYSVISKTSESTCLGIS